MPKDLNADPPNPNTSAQESQGLSEKAQIWPGETQKVAVPLPAWTITSSRPAKTMKEQPEMRAQKGGGPRMKLS